MAATTRILDRNLSMPLEPKLAPCGRRCPHRRPALSGPFGYLVKSGSLLVVLKPGEVQNSDWKENPLHQFASAVVNFVCLLSISCMHSLAPHAG